MLLKRNILVSKKLQAGNNDYGAEFGYVLYNGLIVFNQHFIHAQKPEKVMVEQINEACYQEIADHPADSGNAEERQGAFERLIGSLKRIYPIENKVVDCAANGAQHMGDRIVDTRNIPEKEECQPFDNQSRNAHNAVFNCFFIGLPHG
jgi:hypothetical protein